MSRLPACRQTGREAGFSNHAKEIFEMTNKEVELNNTEKVSSEKKSYGIYFFTLSILMGISFVWSVYDESVSRRPWKEYQKEFLKLEFNKLKKELEEARKDVTSPETKEIEDKLKKLRKQYQEKGETPEYRNALRELDKKETRLFEVSQELQFAKSLAEEAYYQYQHAFDTGGDYKTKKNEWEKLYAAAKKLEPEIEKAKKKRDEVKKKVENYRGEITELEEKLEKYKESILKIENKLEILSKKIPEINQVVINDFDRNNFEEPVLKVDRCQSCHMGIDRKGFENFKEPFKTHSNFEIFIAKHPVEKFGCTSCHDGQESGLTFYDAAHTPKSKEQKAAWEKKYGWKPISHWEKPMLQGDFIQSSCRRCHSHEEDIPGAPVLSEGINLFRERMGCVNCHLVKGYEDVNKIGPDLKNVGTKVDSSWVFRWIKNPKWHHSKTRMPNFKLSDKETLSVASFLMSLKEDENWKVYKLRPGILGNKVLIETGRRLVQDIGCNGCHTIGETEVYKNKNRDIAPILTNIGNKTTPEWILNWILAPVRYSQKTLMPNLRLSLNEAEAIVAYLYSLRDPNFEKIKDLNEKIKDKGEIEKGLKVISDYGCYGCHNIPGTEKLGRVGAELSNFGNKELYELAFGYVKDVERSWFGYARAKLKTPRIFETEIVVQKMPDFGLSDEEIHALTVLLKSYKDKKIPKEFTKEVSSNYEDIQKGRKLIKKYNCIGCHEVEKDWDGGNIMVPLKAKYNEIEAKSYAPPRLVGEGAKVQSEWLFKFLHQPYTIRPWLSLRMPTFNLTDEQVNSIIRYFQSVTGEDVFYHFWQEREFTAQEKGEMKALIDTLQCFKCHQFGKGGGGVVSAAELAPDLSLAKGRLKPKWIMNWLINPQSLQPGTRMPNFFFDIDEEGTKTELLPEPEKKMELLRNYMFSFK
ncbi:MAG: putative octahem cytochrome c [Candidatus Gottesmanbacteria bacterium GW2011_GWC2_39_8]|uniref:Putative octahem cytochrome c n=1 Tax=Candidatus Gottesmanbacteria bacterium GW2011_GWC2_39_8 TaxID=1618450 RepID=A0A0G0T1W7_9BACT|nr:MAG: putative octahem cytochrome c [Candidatus Gottesmanbacteria bacterium GW2011_GWC2_39_8]